MQVVQRQDNIEKDLEDFQFNFSESMRRVLTLTRGELAETLCHWNRRVMSLNEDHIHVVNTVDGAYKILSLVM